MINVDYNVISAYRKSTTEYNKIVIDNEEFPINNVIYIDDAYEDGNIFGTAIARSLEFTILNTIDLEEKEIQYYHGIKTEDGTIAYEFIGNFIVVDVEPRRYNKY